MSVILECEHIRFSYPETDREILKDISLQIEEGSFTAVLGHNASGKSTLAKHFNAILLPTDGKVFVNGMDTSDESNLLRIRQTVGMVFQNPDNQIVSSVVEEDVAFAPENLGISPEEIRKRVDDALRVVGTTEYIHHAPHLLSGGQKQRIAIAGVIAMEPRCIVLDEPTAMLDPVGRHEVMKTLHELNREKGITIILITHHMEEAMDAHRVLVINDGRIAMDDSPDIVLSQPEQLSEFGLAAPETVQLMWSLNQNGFHLPLSAMSVNACADAILSEMGAKT